MLDGLSKGQSRNSAAAERAKDVCEVDFIAVSTTQVSWRPSYLWLLGAMHAPVQGAGLVFSE